MIKASFIKDSSNRITNFVITGHADYDEHGQDIVCAAVSVSVIEAINSIEILAGVKGDVEIDEEEGGLITFAVKYDNTPEQNHDVELLLNHLYNSYKDIVKEYSAFAGYAD
ncbi:hypothetical protein RD055328_04710 [Companilactobacillus sp. RD055328]|uniref:ribosomal-processing cysteine protease Prp n=1 Tax=Companilactobacillus sp. RD055328 TaxID=2916634 RepID=UPI001FC8386A|nr:ribosomal-processing cysteine protease Prp [Companilactobacillus sp. RD055328]GKQ42548.1 hypothetical protein RD055328_04710 [Companilactobacillus sp. RD055328]